MIATLKTWLARTRTQPGVQPTLTPALLKSLLPLMVLAMGLTALVLMYLWRDQSAYKPVFGAREKVSAAEMMSVLDAGHIAYRVHPDSGQVLVPESDLGRVRMLLAAKGVSAKLPSGLELMDRNDPLGVSQFVQDVRFRRGLEGELAQSIMTLDAVESARVHLSIARSTSFVASDGEKSSASVVLALKPGRTLSAEQTASVINLVAGSVGSLSPQRVSLVDQAGNLLSARVDLSEGFDGGAAGHEASKRFQDDTRRGVHDLLAPVVGEDNFKVSVTAAVDNDRIDETQERYGDTPKITSEATREEQDRYRSALGVPGSLSNRPVSASASASDRGGTTRKNATTRQYTYDRSITQIKRSRGRLHKLGVAVVLNNAAAPLPQVGWTPAEVANIDQLLRNGLGIDDDRGDHLMVSAMSFPAKPPAIVWWQQRDTVFDLGSQLLKGLGALLLFLWVARPLLKLAQQRFGAPSMPLALGGAQALSTPLVALAPPTAADAQGIGAGTHGAGMPVVPLLENHDLPPPGSPVDVMVDHLKVLAATEPERVAEVVKQWVQHHERS